LTTTQLLLEGAGTFSLTQANNDVDTLAASNTAGSVEYRDSDGFTVGSVTPVGGGTAVNGVSATTFVTLCTITGDLSLQQQVNATSTGTVRLQANAGNVTQNSNGTITAVTLGVNAGTNVGLDQASNQLASGGTFAAKATGSVAFMNANGFVLGTVTAQGCFT